jgi:peptide/nickel transport system permease protein
VQFWHFLVNAAQGEFGLSLRQGAKVSRLIAERFPATLELALVAALLALVIGVPMGVYAALKRGTFTSQLFMTLSLLGVSLPTFLIGILLILVFAVTWAGSPASAAASGAAGWWSTGLLTAKGWHHIVLPAITLAIFQLTLIMRLVRAEMLEVLRTDYIKFARARPVQPGHPLWPCAQEHAGAGDDHHRPAAGRPDRLCHHHRDGVPVAGHGPAVHPGRDVRRHPVMAAYLCLIALIFVVINLVVDLLYFVVDPRLRVGKAGGH